MSFIISWSLFLCIFALIITYFRMFLVSWATQSTKGGAVEAERCSSEWLTALHPLILTASLIPQETRYDTSRAGFTYWLTEVGRWITASLFRSNRYRAAHRTFLAKMSIMKGRALKREFNLFLKGWVEEGNLKQFISDQKVGGNKRGKLKHPND